MQTRAFKMSSTCYITFIFPDIFLLFCVGKQKQKKKKNYVLFTSEVE